LYYSILLIINIIILNVDSLSVTDPQAFSWPRFQLLISIQMRRARKATATVLFFSVDVSRNGRSCAIGRSRCADGRSLVCVTIFRSTDNVR